jgi:hypothetical protein
LELTGNLLVFRVTVLKDSFLVGCLILISAACSLESFGSAIFSHSCVSQRQGRGHKRLQSCNPVGFDVGSLDFATYRSEIRVGARGNDIIGFNFSVQSNEFHLSF